MRKLIHASLMFVFLILFVSTAFVSADLSGRGSIRGTIYQDLDGNGVCGGGDTLVGNFGLQFMTADGAVTLNLISGSDGTYGLVGAGLGEWIVTAVPPTSSWIVTSANPVTVITSDEDPIATNINFCVQGGGSAVSTQTAESSLSSIGGNATSPVSGQAPSSDLEANFAVSENLLSAPSHGPAYSELEDFVQDGDGNVVLGDQPEWLAYVNQFRSAANLPLVTESAVYTQGATNHSRFMVMNDLCCAHSENSLNPLFTESGNASGVNGNIFSSTWTGSKMEHAVNFWISAPFHILGILDPALSEVGYGEFRQEIGVFHYASVLDVRSNEVDSVEVPDSIYPIFFPANGSETFIVRRSLPEWPDPLATPACSSYSTPTGPALVLMIGDGDQTPIVTSQKVFENGRQIESCTFSETSYENPDPYAQQTGRIILGTRDAIIVTPRNPLNGGFSYRVELTVNGENYSWEFTARQK